jgi:hypothetical protein
MPSSQYLTSVARPELLLQNRREFTAANPAYVSRNVIL